MTYDMKNALHRISLASQNSMSSKDECGRIAREALAAEEARAEKTWQEERGVFERAVIERDALRETVRSLREQAKRADDEATTLANSDLATTEQVVRALRAENERLREACTLALNVMEQKNRVNVPPFAKFITVEFAPDDVAVLRAALEKKP
jgi:hypothetical protein